MTAATIAYGVLLLFVASSRPDQCQRYPFWPSPEMYYDYHTCSTVIDWSNFIDKTCRENFVRYEVQLAVNGCTPPYSTYITTNERFDLQYYIPGGCLADSNCYARVRAQLREGNSWSDYSPWIGLSNTFKMVQACVVTGNDLCLPIQKCSGDALPTFIINKERYIPVIDDEHFNVTIANDNICFRSVVENVHYVEFCHELLSICPSYDSSNEYNIILKRAQIAVTPEQCSDCYDSMEVQISTLTSGGTSHFTGNRQCVIIDLNEWEVLSSISGSLQNMCVSTASSQDNLPSTVIYNLQLAASIKMLPEGSINSTEVQPGPIYYCQKQSDVNKEIENYAISLPERRNDSIMYLNLCSGVHALTTNADTERVTHRNRATHQNTLGSHTILLIALNVIMCNIIPAIV